MTRLNNWSPPGKVMPLSSSCYYDESPCYSWTRSPGLFDIINEEVKDLNLEGNPVTAEACSTPSKRPSLNGISTKPSEESPKNRRNLSSLKVKPLQL